MATTTTTTKWEISFAVWSQMIMMGDNWQRQPNRNKHTHTHKHTHTTYIYNMKAITQLKVTLNEIYCNKCG